MTIDHRLRPVEATPARRPRTPVLTPGAWWIIGLAIATTALVAAFLFWGSGTAWAYLIPRRATQLGALVTVAAAVGVSTVIFQTVTGNRILTPSIMGFDALYLLLQTSLVFALGSHTVIAMGSQASFALETVLMLGAALLLYRWLLDGRRGSLHLTLLIGIVFAALFRGISSLLQRLIDPNEFMFLSDMFFANFTQVDASLVIIAAVIVGVLGVFAWWQGPVLDVLGLGPDAAVSLGVNYKRTMTGVLVVSAALVAVSTALVGPVTFFGLLVANLAYPLASTYRHRIVLPIATLLGCVALVGGQLLLERALGMGTALSIIIDFVGGIVFIFLLLRGSLK